VGRKVDTMLTASMADSSGWFGAATLPDDTSFSVAPGIRASTAWYACAPKEERAVVEAGG
jgi:hypothetical protein